MLSFGRPVRRQSNKGTHIIPNLTSQVNKRGTTLNLLHYKEGYNQYDPCIAMYREGVAT